MEDEAHAPYCRVTADSGYALMKNDGTIEDIYNEYKPKEMDSEQWYEITKQLNDKKYTYIYTNPTQNNNIRLVRKHITAEDPEVKNEQQWSRIQVREVLKIVRDTLNKDKKKKKAEKSNKNRRDRKKYYKFISIKMNEYKNKTNECKRNDVHREHNGGKEAINNNNNKNNNFTKRIEKTFEKRKNT